MVEIWTRLSEKERAIGLIQSFHAAPDGTDIKVRCGLTEAGQPSILITIGNDDFPLLADSALAIARIIDDVEVDLGDDGGLGVLATGLRMAAAEAEQWRPSTKDQPQ